MASDWVKSRDTEFQTQVQHLVSVVGANLQTWGLVPNDLAALRENQAAFEVTLCEQAEQAAVYHAAVARKQAQRQRLERELRALVRRINNHPGMTDSLRQQMNLASPTRSETQKEFLHDTLDETGEKIGAAHPET